MEYIIYGTIEKLKFLTGVKTSVLLLNMVSQESLNKNKKSVLIKVDDHIPGIH